MGWDAGDKLAILGRASQRLELVPFGTDEVLEGDGGYSVRPYGRFVDGLEPDAMGAGVATEPIPYVLGVACALLARWYSDNPDVELDQASGLDSRLTGSRLAAGGA